MTNADTIEMMFYTEIKQWFTFFRHFRNALF